MATRDDFTVSVKRVLAARVGHRCANPECRALTSGPQLDEGGAVNVGVAAHVTAAAPGGPRYDATLTAAERGGAENGIWLCQTCAKLVDSDQRRFTARTLWGWKGVAEHAAREQVGRTEPRARGVRAARARTPSGSEREAEIRRTLKLRNALRRALLRPAGERPPTGRVTHPYQQFAHRRVVVRSLDDTTYPGTDDAREGISSWFRVGLYDFYPDGLEVILGITSALVDGDGTWRLHRPDANAVHAPEERRVKVWCIGRIPFRFIRGWDIAGDEVYQDPHLYCTFANDGEPYEGVRYATVGDETTPDWPLPPDRQRPSPSE